MLARIIIRGLALVDELSIDLGKQFNVVTGETGAGKSILIKALSLALGHRAHADDVRSGFDLGWVVCEFHLPKNHRALEMLAQLGVMEADAGQVLIRRQVNKKGRSQAWINDTPVTLNSLKELGYELVDLSSQHENHRILNQKEHIRYLDQFVTSQSLILEVKEAYQAAKGAQKDFHGAYEQYLSLLADIDYFRFRYQEIKDLDPHEEEYEQLEKRVLDQKASLHLNRAIEEALRWMEGEGMGLSEVLLKVQGALKSAGHPELNPFLERAQGIAADVDDLSFELNKWLHRGEEERASLEEAHKRLEAYRALMNRYRFEDIASLLKEYNRLFDKISYVDAAPSELLQKAQEFCLTVQKLVSKAEKLTQARKGAARQVETKVKKELNDLSMRGAVLKVEFLKREAEFSGAEYSHLPELDLKELRQAEGVLNGYQETGAEGVRFLFQANAGEAFRPLQQIASGGEVSRILLAIKKALAAGAETCVLVFDEIDSGISGKVADLVGQKLAELARSFQVISVSHLPQVACYADRHFKVSKASKMGRTVSSIGKLSHEERVKELARLLSGDKLTQASVENARALFLNAHKRGGASLKDRRGGSRSKSKELSP